MWDSPKAAGPHRWCALAGLNLWADHSRCVRPPFYPQQLAHQLGLGGDGLMDALGLSFEIRVELANDNPGMRRLCSVQPDEMQAI